MKSMYLKSFHVHVHPVPPTEINIFLEGLGCADDWAQVVVKGSARTVTKLLGSLDTMSFGGFDVTARDVKCLHNPFLGGHIQDSYLTDQLINGFCGVLGPYCKDAGVVLMNSQMSAEARFGTGVSELAHDSLGRCRAFSKSKRLLGVKAVKWVLLPCNLAKGEGSPHWFLSVFSTASMQWSSFDSLNKDRSDVLHALHSPLMKQMGLAEDTPFSYQPKIGPLQSGLFQCGELTCMFAMALVQGKQLPAMAVSNPSAFATSARLFIAKCLFTNNLTPL